MPYFLALDAADALVEASAINQSPVFKSEKKSFQLTRLERDIFILSRLNDCRLRWQHRWLLAYYLPIAQDWAFLASFPAGLPQILNDHVMVAESIFAITIAQQRDVNVFALFTMVNCGFINLGDINFYSNYVAHVIYFLVLFGGDYLFGILD
jgi:hypothetical protein